MDRQMRTDPHPGRPATPAEQRPSGAVSARDSGLRRIGRFNRWLVAGAVGLTAFFSAVAALAHPGSSRKGAAAAPAPTTTTSAAPATTDTTQSSAPAAGAVDPSAATDNSQPLPPQAAPQVDPAASAPPVATSGGS
jgi:hypothetical protein